MTPQFYRTEARRCRERAAQSSHAGQAAQWLTMAREYEQIAAELAGGPDTASARSPGHSDAMQDTQRQPPARKR